MPILKEKLILMINQLNYLKNIFTCRSWSANTQDNTTTPISVMFIRNASHMGISGNAKFVAPRIIRNIVPGVMKDDTNKNE